MLPASQPGFLVQHDEVVPYTFEPMPIEQYYRPYQAPPQYPERYPDVSSKNQPAVAVMAPAEYHHVGVSETELAEMWAMLEDENGASGLKQNPSQVQFTPTGTLISNDMNEEDMESYSNLPSESSTLSSAPQSLSKHCSYSRRGVTRISPAAPTI